MYLEIYKLKHGFWSCSKAIPQLLKKSDWWWVEFGRKKSKGRLLTRVSFRYLTGERSVVLLDIDFDAENQDEIVRTVKKLSDLMRERNIELSKAKELLCGGKIDDKGKVGINWKSLQDEFINL